MGIFCYTDTTTETANMENVGFSGISSNIKFGDSISEGIFMKTIKEIKENPKLEILQAGIDGISGILHMAGLRHCTVVASWGGGWEHVSVCPSNRLPDWTEMCAIKDMFWNDDEVVMQLHPAKSNYVNLMPNCLHLWKPIGQEIPVPPTLYV